MSSDPVPGARLRALRQGAKLSQPQAAARLGVDPNTLSRYELGKMRLPADVLAKAEHLWSDTPRSIEAGDTVVHTRDGVVVAESKVAAPADGGAFVLVPRDALMYWRGRLDSDLRSLHGVGRQIDALGESLQALRGMLENATAGVAGFVDSGVLPDAATLASILRPATPEEAAEALSALRVAEDAQARAVAAGTAPPPRARHRAAG